MSGLLSQRLASSMMVPHVWVRADLCLLTCLSSLDFLAKLMPNINRLQSSYRSLSKKTLQGKPFICPFNLPLSNRWSIQGFMMQWIDCFIQMKKGKDHYSMDIKIPWSMPLTRRNAFQVRLQNRKHLLQNSVLHKMCFTNFFFINITWVLIFFVFVYMADFYVQYNACILNFSMDGI